MASRHSPNTADRSFPGMTHQPDPPGPGKMGVRLALVIGLFILLAARPGLAENERDLTASGLSAYQQQEYQKALESFQKARVLRPEDPLSSFNLGNAHYKMKQYEEAGKCYHEAARAEDQALKQMARYNLGNTFYRLGNLPEAIKNYQEALKIDPGDRDAQKNLDFVMKKLEQQQKQQDRSQPRKQDKEQDREEKSSDRKQQKSGEDKQQSQGQNKPEQKDRDQKQSPPPAGSGDRENKPEQDKSPEKPEGSEQDRNKGEAPPRYGSSLDSNQDRDQDRDEERGKDLSRPQAGKNGKPKESPRDMSQAQRMLNRLKDKPGRALMPAYQERQVERDW